VAQPGRCVIIRTNADTDFTAALAQNAGLFDSFPLLGAGQTYWVESVQIISVQNLAWELWFFDRETPAIPSDPNDDGFRGVVTFTAGLQIGGAGFYHYSANNLSIPGDCLDYRAHVDKYPLLHVALVNRSATGKNADATGAIVVQVALNPGIGGS